MMQLRTLKRARVISFHEITLARKYHFISCKSSGDKLDCLIFNAKLS